MHMIGINYNPKWLPQIMSNNHYDIEIMNTCQSWVQIMNSKPQSSIMILYFEKSNLLKEFICYCARNGKNQLNVT